MDGSITLAKAPPVPETGRHARETSGRDLELLSHQSSSGHGGSHQREHQVSLTPWPWVSESPVPTAQSSTHGGHSDRICGFQESGLKMAFLPDSGAEPNLGRGLKPHPMRCSCC